MQKEDVYTIIINLEKLNDTLEKMSEIHKDNREIAKETRNVILNKIKDEDYITEMGKGEEMLVKATEALIKTDKLIEKQAELITKLKIAELLKEFAMYGQQQNLLGGGNRNYGDNDDSLMVPPGTTKSDLLKQLNKNDSD